MHLAPPRRAWLAFLPKGHRCGRLLFVSVVGLEGESGQEVLMLLLYLGLGLSGNGGEGLGFGRIGVGWMGLVD